MNRCTSSVFWVAVLGLALGSVASAQEDYQGCQDYPLVSRIPGFFIEGCKDLPFASYKFMTKEGRREPVEGRHRSITYRLPKDAPDRSGVEMIRNYTNAIKAIGGEVLYEGRYSGSMRIVVEGREVRVEVAPSGKRRYRLDIVETQAMEQQVVADAEALLADLNRTGRVVLTGIFFDTDKAEVKPDSAPALEEIARLLADNPDTTAFVVGHTDMSGTFEQNLSLSERRAAAVVEVLITDYGVASDRLTPQGVGPLAPMASNSSEQGRALNRRVELVRR